MTDSVEGTVRQAFVEVLGVAAGDLRPESSPDTIAAWDSSTHISLMMAIEEMCGVTFDPLELMEVQTFGDIVARVRASRV
jgi:acyl carrier protein